LALADLQKRRLVIVTGKGGVGKTTVAGSLARAWARTGKRVLCAEITAHEDTPSALTEVLGGPRPHDEPVLAQQDLWTVLLTPSAGHKAFLQDTLPLRMLADAAMKSAGLRRFLLAAPGFSDMGVMYRMLDLMRRKHPSGGPMFERCIIDSPATGHALALAQIPELMIRVIPGGPIVRAAKEGLEILTNAEQCAALIVTLPETLPVTESLELKAGLARHKVPVAGVLVNRVPANPFSVEERAALDTVIGNGKQVFGQRELKRISRSDAALALLEEQAGEGQRSLPDLELKGQELSDALATRLLYLCP
jgi:arsenite/tail-anchored protein-transporting ATPase